MDVNIGHGLFNPERLIKLWMNHITVVLDTALDLDHPDSKAS